MTKKKKRSGWGGYREGSGRLSAFPGKANRMTVTVTSQARQKIADGAVGLGVSMSDYVEAAVRQYEPAQKDFAV